MTGYNGYITYLDGLIASITQNKYSVSREEIHKSLNGGASAALINSVSAKDLKRDGVFFTEEKLARYAVGDIGGFADLSVIDPACGAGDLLLRWAEQLPVYRSLLKTLRLWSELLYGSDIHEEFVLVAKRRLTALAISRGSRLNANANLDIDSFFHHIKRENFLNSFQNLSHGAVILNPPFAPLLWNKADWTSGKTSQAAIFLMKCVESSEDKTRITAILPDVLRCGTRYRKWRLAIQNNFRITRLEPMGRFGKNADVDVFILGGEVSAGHVHVADWSSYKKSDSPVLQDMCEIKVGSVVPHRDDVHGPSVRYLTASNLPPWTTIVDGPRRLVKSSTIVPPFVAVRRTSSPSDRERPIASIVAGKGRVALENHLIALRPHDGSIQTCKEIIKILRREKTREYLDVTMRCRHLTVKSLKELPI